MNENKINDGGLAFGGKRINKEVRDKLMENRSTNNLSLSEILNLCTESTGMSLRDYFANSVMNGLIANGIPHDAERSNGEYHRDFIAKTSYQMADAMIKAREVK